MRKLRLDLSELTVESFTAREDSAGGGTVLARDSGTQYQTCEPADTCNNNYTCDALSCDGVCGTYFCTLNC